MDFSHTTRSHYSLHECVAHTERGAVYRATHHHSGENVAVKVLLTTPDMDDNALMRFQMEAVIAFRLKHHYIVPLQDYWSDGDGVWLVMRWMAGGSLRQRLQNHGAMSVPDVLTMLHQLAQALTRAHLNNIVHRDIKPDNILFDVEGNAYLTDFGVAKRLNADEITEPDATVGSPAYYSPEQIRKLPITPQTDIYALAYVAQEAMMGTHPYGAFFRSMQVIMKHLNEPMPPLELSDAGLAAAFSPILQRATQKDASQRQETILDFVGELERAYTDYMGIEA